MRAALYARVSDDKKKADGERRQDINRQLEILRAHLQRAGVTEWREYIDDNVSAYTEDINQRPKFKEMMRDAKAHWIDVIYVESLDRFSRKLTMGLIWLEELRKAGCTITSLHEGEIDVTINQDWIRSAIALMFGEWYCRELAVKVKSGMARVKAKGKPIGRPRKKAGGYKGGKTLGGIKGAADPPFFPPPKSIYSSGEL